MALLGSACGSDGASESADPGWSPRELAAAPRYDAVGPHPVGLVTAQLSDGSGGAEPVVVWYPAAQGLAGETVADAPADDTGVPYPLVLFAHGLGLAATDHARLLAHVASWGFVVAAPERTKGADLIAMGDALRAQAQGASTPLVGLLSAKGPLVVGGHSAGTTYAVYAAAGERADEVRGIILLAGGGPAASGVTSASPSLFLTGGRDPATKDWVRPGFAIVTEPSELVVIHHAGHLSFTDLCDGEPGPGVTEQDCAPPEVGDKSLWPTIDHATVAFLRWRFGLDESAVALDPDVLSSVGGTPLEVEGSLTNSG